jgi:Cu(I)-responsive transcriptional regulator
MRIGELARATGTNAETIRYYEREGILPAAERTDSNYRDYSAEHVEALTFVRRARDLGFAMAKVRKLLSLSDSEDKPCEDVALLVQAQVAEVDRKIADLTLLREELNRMLRSCEGERIGECRIVESLGRRS